MKQPNDLVYRREVIREFQKPTRSGYYGGSVFNVIRNVNRADAIPMSVIEDIKTEIANMEGDINGYYVHKDDVLAIIDKHILAEESEGK